MLKIRGVFLLLSLLTVQGVMAQSDNLVKRYLNNVLSESGDPSARRQRIEQNLEALRAAIGDQPKGDG